MTIEPQFIIYISTSIASAFLAMTFFLKKERRFFKNMQRPIFIIGTENLPMIHEADLLDRVGFFKVRRPSSDHRTIDLLDGHQVAIIGYTPNSDLFKDAFNAVKRLGMAIIVYAETDAITENDMSLIKSYSHQSMCNTPLRLISDVFNIVSTYPGRS